MNKLSAICLSAALVSGCAVIDRLDGSRCAPTADGRVPVESVQVMNTNWKLLACIPIASGDTKHPDDCTCSWFSDTVTLQNQLDMLAAEAKRVGATKAVNVETAYTDERILFFLLKREKMHTSATLVK